MNRHARRAAQKTGKPIAGKPSTPDELFVAGCVHLRARELNEAEDYARRALAIDADHADALQLMGATSLQKGNYALAVDWYMRSLRQEVKVICLVDLGTALKALGRDEEAFRVFDKALELEPENSGTWKRLGHALRSAERYDEAELSYKRSLELNPLEVDAAHASGYMQFNLDRYQKAIERFDQVLAIQPDQLATISIRAMCMVWTGRFEEACAELERAMKLPSKDGMAINDLGRALQLVGRHEDALAKFNEALALQPDLRGVRTNIPPSLCALRRFDEAFEVSEELLKREPTSVLGHWNLGLIHMLVGNFEAGWREREWRWLEPSFVSAEMKYPQAAWRGESLEGKTILIHGDEGQGDQIQYARYVPLIAARGARIVLQVGDSLRSLLAGLPGVVQCVPRSVTAAPPFDFHCSTSSLPLAFGTTLETIPADVPYLPAPSEALRQEWERRLGAQDRLRVGLVWSGSAGHKNDHNRSMTLETLAPLLDLDATFVSLQKEVRERDKATLLHEQSRILDVANRLTDFSWTAALMSCLDVIVSVDTSVVHLAGALGRPVWTMVAYDPDFRWMYDREDSPWYPTMKLFRQPSPNDWADVVARIRRELQDMIARR